MRAFGRGGQGGIGEGSPVDRAGEAAADRSAGRDQFGAVPAGEDAAGTATTAALLSPLRSRVPASQNDRPIRQGLIDYLLSREVPLRRPEDQVADVT